MSLILIKAAILIFLVVVLIFLMMRVERLPARQFQVTPHEIINAPKYNGKKVSKIRITAKFAGDRGNLFINELIATSRTGKIFRPTVTTKAGGKKYDMDGLFNAADDNGWRERPEQAADVEYVIDLGGNDFSTIEILGLMKGAYIEFEYEGGVIGQQNLVEKDIFYITING